MLEDSIATEYDKKILCTLIDTNVYFFEMFSKRGNPGAVKGLWHTTRALYDELAFKREDDL